MQPTQVLQRSIRRLKLTTKQTNKGYYKGTGSGAMGRHTSRGKYIVEYHKVRTYVCPDLTGFDVSFSIVLAVNGSLINVPAHAIRHETTRPKRDQDDLPGQGRPAQRQIVS